MAISYGTYTITEVQEGSQIWTTTTAPSSPNYTFTVSKLVGDSDTSIKVGDIVMYSYYRYTVLSISSDGTTVLTGNRTSIRGATGAPSVTYSLIVSNLAIIKDKNNNLSPTSITLTAKSQTGSNAMANYSGRFKIETTTDNSTWTAQYTSSANEATKNWNVIDNIVAIRCSLYLKDGTTTLLDQQTIPIVSDGVDGTNITITSTSVTYQKGTSGTTKPTGTWGTSIPSVGEGEYLWTKTVVTYSDNSTTESYSVSRNAVNGTNGTSPTVTGTVTEYVQSSSGTTTPSSGWNTTPPTAIAEQFMWTRTTITYSDDATAVSYTVSKNGANGSNGINTATVYLYKKGATAPSVPSGNTTYTFSTKKLTGTLDSWSQTIPTSGDGQCYVIAAVASSSGTTDTIGTGEWSTPIQFNGTNGTNGDNGLNQATIFLYKRGASVTKPTTSVTYTFSTGALSAEPNSWKRNIPTIDGNPCWVVTATAIGNGTTATITGSNWSDPVKLVEDGEDGKDAYTIVLTNENHTFAGNTTSAIASEIECNIIAYKGTTQVASTIGTITGQPTGMTTSLLNNGTVNSAFKVTVTTSMATMNGVLTVPVTVDGKTFTKKFTYSLALKGSAGTSQNLLMDVYASSLTKVDAPWNRYLSDANNSTITGEFIAESNLPDPNATHFYRITDSSASAKGRALCFYSGVGATPPFIDGHTYRIGCWVRKHDGSPKIQITIGSYGSWMPVHKRIENTEWEWFEIVHTFGETDASKTTQSDTYKKLYIYFYNNNVAGSSLDMCGFRMEEVQTNSGTARNFILSTEKLADWITTQGATISNGVVTFPDVTADTWREACSAKSFKYDLIRNQYVIFSIKVKADSDKKCCFYLNISVDNDETTHIRQKYFDQYIYFTGNGEWQTVCLAVPVFDYMFNSGSGTVDFDDCWVAIRFGAANNYWNGFQAKEPQLCLGTTATSWSKAPEDIDEEVSNLRTDLQSQIDEKIQTYYQATAPSWSSATDRAKHNGDLWYCTESDPYTEYEEKNVYRYDSASNTWVAYSATSELFDAVDGKSTIFYGTTSDTFENVDTGDYLVDSVDGSSYRWSGTQWVKVTDYQTAIDNIEIGGRNLLKGSDVAHTSLSGTTVGGTTTQVIPSGTVITLSVQVDADNVVWGSSGNKRIGVASSIPKDSGGTQYIEAWAAMTGRSGTGIDKTFDTSFHGRVKSTYTLQGELPLNKAFNLYVQSVTSGAVSVSRPKLEIGNKSTDWTPAPEDINAEISTKADSTDAVFEEQLIYISKASGTLTVNGTTTWITENGDVQNTWSTKRPTYDTDYPVLFIAKQRKTVSGTVTCTTPLKDDTTTIIDGGHITTGTIDASQVSVTNIDASNISTGILSADVIGANSIDASKIDVSSISIRNLNGASNYAQKTDIGWCVLINVSSIDFINNTATIHASVYKDGNIQSSGFTLQWYKTTTSTSVTPEETTTTVISNATSSILSVTDLDASYTCVVN